MAIRSPLRAEPRVSEVKRRLAAAEAMQDTLLNLGEESNAALPERAYAGVLDSVRRRFDEAEALQKSLRHALSEELARTQQLQSRLKERPIERPIERTERAVHGVHSPTAQQAELRRELQNVRAERDAASAQCRLQAKELHSLSHTVEALREQVHVRDDEHRELVRSLSLSLGTCGESDLASEELQRRLDAITATRDAALQSAQQERASLEVLQQQLEAMRSERDESIFRLKAEEQRWQVRKDELALAESRLEDTAQRESARRRADAETVRLSTARCAEAEAAKRSMEDQLTEERAFTGELRLEVQSLKATVTRLQEEIGKAQALQCDGEFESWQSQEKLEKQLHSVKQALDALRVRAQVKESLLEQTELELQKNVRRLTELSSEKAQWQWEAAEQGKAANQLRQRLQMAEEKLLEAVRENRAEAEASFLLAESRKQLATLEDGKRSLMEGLEWEKAEVHRFKAELQRAVQERDLHKAREMELVEVESRSQGTLRKLQLEYAELLAGLEQERSARRHLEEAAWPKERAKWDEELKQERRWRMDLEDEVQVQKRLRQEAEDSLAEVERRLGSIEVEQKKICLVETDRAKQRAENLQLREEILDLTAKLEVERYRVRKLEGGTAAASGLSPTAGPESKRLRLHAEAREQSDLMALRTLLSTTMRERDEALEKALRLQRVNRSVEELHQLLEKAMQDRERALADQDDLQTLQSTWDLVEQLRAEMPSPSRKHAQAEDSDRMDEFPREVVEVPRSPKGAEIKWIIANAEEPIAGRPAPVTSVNSAKDLIIQEASSSPRSPSTSMVSTSYGLSPPTRPKPGS